MSDAESIEEIGETDMVATFDAATRDKLRVANEVVIHTSAKPNRGVVIWVVAVDDSVFARSFRGPGAKWYTATLADGRATLTLDDGRWPIRVTPVTDAMTIDAVSAAYLEKYAASPYAKQMVRTEILPITVRFDLL